ncbi:ATPase [Burkholderia sp. KK1]|nr:ATPase [Burkholderia sp. KK1]
MTSDHFVYVTYIRTTPEKLWSALTTPEWQRQYWFSMHQESDWKAGSAWKMLFSDGRVADAGEVLEAEPGKRLVLKWRNEFREDLKDEGWSRCTYEIERHGDDAVKLTVTHASEGRKFIEAVSGGWPKILSNLKSLLETGRVAIETK